MNILGRFKKIKTKSVSGKVPGDDAGQKETAALAAKAPTGGNHGILERPVVSEKATFLEAKGRYIFQVADGATKPEISKAVEQIFGVKVEKVNIIREAGKTKFLRGHLGRQSGFKKAIVKLKEGDKIEVIPH